MIADHHLRRRLEAGHRVAGPIVNFASTWFVDLCGPMGFDFVLIDCEHGPMSPETVEPMIRAAEAAGISPLVRVPVNAAHEMLRYLDIGAAGIKVPRVETAADARAAATALRYPPLGTRGFARSTRAAHYGVADTIGEYVERANRELMLIVLVETAEGVRNIDAIAQTPGVDLVALGPGDLAMSMGYAGDAGHPEVVRAMAHVIERSKARGKWTSLPAGNAKAAAECYAKGADLVFVGPAAWLVQAGRELMREAANQ
jgi:4-hydroxy-2-oxoheptanedioate aldolase